MGEVHNDQFDSHVILHNFLTVQLNKLCPVGKDEYKNYKTNTHIVETILHGYIDVATEFKVPSYMSKIRFTENRYSVPKIITKYFNFIIDRLLSVKSMLRYCNRCDQNNSLSCNSDFLNYCRLCTEVYSLYEVSHCSLNILYEIFTIVMERTSSAVFTLVDNTGNPLSDFMYITDDFDLFYKQLEGDVDCAYSDFDMQYESLDIREKYFDSTALYKMSTSKITIWGNTKAEEYWFRFISEYTLRNKSTLSDQLDKFLKYKKEVIERRELEQRNGLTRAMTDIARKLDYEAFYEKATISDEAFNTYVKIKESLKRSMINGINIAIEENGYDICMNNDFDNVVREAISDFVLDASTMYSFADEILCQDNGIGTIYLSIDNNNMGEGNGRLRNKNFYKSLHNGIIYFKNKEKAKSLIDNYITIEAKELLQIIECIDKGGYVSNLSELETRLINKFKHCNLPYSIDNMKYFLLTGDEHVTANRFDHVDHAMNGTCLFMKYRQSFIDSHPEITGKHYEILLKPDESTLNLKYDNDRKRFNITYIKDNGIFINNEDKATFSSFEQLCDNLGIKHTSNGWNNVDRFAVVYERK